MASHCIILVFFALYQITFSQYNMAPYLTCWEQNNEDPTGFKDPIWNDNASDQCLENPDLCNKYQTQGLHPGNGDVCDIPDRTSGSLPNMCYFNVIFLNQTDAEKSWSWKCWSDVNCPLKDENDIGIEGCLITEKRISCCCNAADFCNEQELFIQYAVWGRSDHYPPDFGEINSYSDLYQFLTRPPTASPTPAPTDNTLNPTKSPTPAPTDIPSFSPTDDPTIHPTPNPTFEPTENPTLGPTDDPSPSPTTNPTFNPTSEPTDNPTPSPTDIPSPSPTPSPTTNPTPSPTISPTNSPIKIPTTSPTVDPTTDPTNDPTKHPTKRPSTSPTTEPSKYPTINPTIYPTEDPTFSPTFKPTSSPTSKPSTSPTAKPSDDPTTFPTKNPSKGPTIDPTINPSRNPTDRPTLDPTIDPTSNPTTSPTNDPTNNPTSNPTIFPTRNPSSDPTVSPTNNPTTEPTINPTKDPSESPTKTPTSNPIISGKAYGELIFGGDDDDVEVHLETNNNSMYGFALTAVSVLINETDNINVIIQNCFKYPTNGTNIVIKYLLSSYNLNTIDSAIEHIDSLIGTNYVYSEDLIFIILSNIEITETESMSFEIIYNPTTTTTSVFNTLQDKSEINADKNPIIWHNSVNIVLFCIIALLLIICSVYLCLYSTLKSAKSSVVSWLEYYQLLDRSDVVILLFTICIEVLDITTDIIFGAALFNYNYSEAQLQSISVAIILFALIGLCGCIIKYILIRKIYGNNQFISLKKQTNIDAESITFIRKIKRDVIIIDFYIVILHDLPQFCIIFNLYYYIAHDLVVDQSSYIYNCGILSFSFILISIIFNIFIKLFLNETNVFSCTKYSLYSEVPGGKGRTDDYPPIIKEKQQKQVIRLNNNDDIDDTDDTDDDDIALILNDNNNN